ncbi:hypothetical protein MMPV_000287 [Pyropia vietnamensis]
MSRRPQRPPTRTRVLPPVALPLHRHSRGDMVATAATVATLLCLLSLILLAEQLGDRGLGSGAAPPPWEGKLATAGGGTNPYAARGGDAALHRLLAMVAGPSPRAARADVDDGTAGGAGVGAGRRLVVVAVADAAVADLALNVACGVATSAGRRLLLFAADEGVYTAAAAAGVAVFLREGGGGEEGGGGTTVVSPPPPVAVRAGGGDAGGGVAPEHAAAAATAARTARVVEEAGPLAPSLASGEGALFGTPAFVALSVRKSAAAAAVLAAGYDVLLTDVDVGWVGDAAAALGAAATAAGGAAVAITSDARGGEPPNWVVNSGLYYASSGSPLPPRAVRNGVGAVGTDGGVDVDGRGDGGGQHDGAVAIQPGTGQGEGGVERLLRAVALYARRQRRSEQKAWNAVACGAFKGTRGGPGRRVGTTACTYRGVRVAVVGTAAFPNGADESLWGGPPATAGVTPGTETVGGGGTRGRDPRWALVVAAHANYVVGRRAKVRRLASAGLWHLGAGTDWQATAATCLRRL